MKHEVTTFNTKKMMSSSLKKFMEKKPLSKITVSEIVKDCGLNRKTFYYHFYDIQDLLKWTLEQEAINTVKQSDLVQDYDEVFNFVLLYVNENKHILNCVYDSMGRGELKNFFYKDFYGITMKLIESLEKTMNITIENINFKNFLCDFYTDILAGQLVKLIKNNDKSSQDTLIKYTTFILKNSLLSILNTDMETLE
ncbi:MAG: TetR/AcrR family transcriptional regulator C-terminal domain-containing protein [Oscillospiraceae bacterium]